MTDVFISQKRDSSSGCSGSTAILETPKFRLRKRSLSGLQPFSPERPIFRLQKWVSSGLVFENAIPRRPSVDSPSRPESLPTPTVQRIVKVFGVCSRRSPLKINNPSCWLAAAREAQLISFRPTTPLAKEQPRMLNWKTM
jgi:hypothetical protein